MAAASAKELGIDRLAVEDRLALIEEIRATIYADPAAFPSEAQRAELDRRVVEDDRFPSEVVSWDEVRNASRARLGL
jgi:putative addiction module component (TIGR02574 family)